MKTFPTLYKKTETGAIQYWIIKVYRPMQPAATDKWAIEVEYGQKDTDKPQTTVDYITEGKNTGKKNETSVQKQAELEAESKWKKKQKTGYTTEENKATTGKIGAFVQAGIKPMLAKNYKDIKPEKLSWPAIIDRKYNGGRVIGKKIGLFTRKGEKYATLPHIEKVLKPVYDKYPNGVIDGEGYNHEYRYKLNEIMSILRKTVNVTDEVIKRSAEKIKFYVYDGYNIGNAKQTDSLIVRRKALAEVLKDIPGIVVVTGEVINNEKELLKKYQEYLDDGYEGAMYRDADSPYENKRSKYLLKVKPEDDDEGIILDIKQGTGNWAETGKTITLNWHGKEFDATLKSSIEEGKKFWNDKNQWIGKEVTFLYMGLTGHGTPNYARIDYNNCLKS